MQVYQVRHYVKLRAVALISILALFIFPPILLGKNLSHAYTVAAILSTENCNAPCLFGMSLENTNYQQVRSLLETSPFTRDAQITFEDNHISWQWSQTVKSWFTSSEYSNLSTWQNVNAIDFSNGLFWDVNIVFALPLKDIIDVFGDNFLVYPFADTGRWEIYGLVYGEPKGVFSTWLNCDNPTISEDTLVSSYYYRKTFNPELNDPTVSIPWRGYTTKLQDCSFFPPG